MKHGGDESEGHSAPCRGGRAALDSRPQGGPQRQRAGHGLPTSSAHLVEREDYHEGTAPATHTHTQGGTAVGVSTRWDDGKPDGRAASAL